MIMIKNDRTVLNVEKTHYHFLCILYAHLFKQLMVQLKFRSYFKSCLKTLLKKFRTGMAEK